MMANSSRNGNSKRNLPKRINLTTTICNSNGATQLHTNEVYGEGGYKFTKSQEKITQLMYIDDIKLFLKNEKKLETLVQTVRI